MTEKEALELVDQFINEKGLWFEFLDFISEKGYKSNELPAPLKDDA